jgi:hypothetical protein
MSNLDMAHAIPFDALAFAKKLESAGIGKNESEAIAEAVAEAFDGNLNASVTKQDLQVLKAEFKTELIKWMVGLLFAQTIILISIVAVVKVVH